MISGFVVTFANYLNKTISISFGWYWQFQIQMIMTIVFSGDVNRFATTLYRIFREKVIKLSWKTSTIKLIWLLVTVTLLWYPPQKYKQLRLLTSLPYTFCIKMELASIKLRLSNWITPGIHLQPSSKSIFRFGQYGRVDQQCRRITVLM